MRKKGAILLAVFLAALLAAAVFRGAAHGGNGAMEDRTSSPRKVLTLLAPYEVSEHRRMLLDLAEAFSKENADLEVKVSFEPYEDYNKRLFIEYSRGSLPDMVIVENSTMPALVRIGMFLPITDYVQGSNLHPLYYDVLWGNVMDNGQYYGMPFTCTDYALFCNLDILSRARAPIPETWEQLKVTAKKSTKDGAVGLGISAKQTEQSTSQFLQLLYSTGATLGSMDQGNGIRAFELLEYMLHDNTLDHNSINLSESDLRRQFVNRKIAMMVNTGSQIPALRDSNAGFQWKAVPLPVDERQACVVCGENIGITKSGDYNACIRFLKFLNRTENIRETALRYGGIPVRRDLTQSVSLADGNVGTVFYDQMEYAVAKGPYRSWPDISEAVGGGIFDLLTSSRSSAAVASALQAEVRDYTILG